MCVRDLRNSNGNLKSYFYISYKMEQFLHLLYSSSLFDLLSLELSFAEQSAKLIFEKVEQTCVFITAWDRLFRKYAPIREG